MMKHRINFLKGNPDMNKIDLTGVEEWREYVFNGSVYRIEKPVAVYFRDGGSTHRVEDSDGVFHIVPAPGNGDAVIRFKGMLVA